MPVSTQNEVKQIADDSHPVLDAGDYHVKGVIEHSAAGELCSADAELNAVVVSLKRTDGGGIAYEFGISADEEPARKAKADAAAKVKADAAVVADKAVADAAAKAQADDDAADARLAKAVAAGVAEAMKAFQPKA